MYFRQCKCLNAILKNSLICFLFDFNFLYIIKVILYIYFDLFQWHFKLIEHFALLVLSSLPLLKLLACALLMPCVLLVVVLHCLFCSCYYVQFAHRQQMPPLLWVSAKLFCYMPTDGASKIENCRNSMICWGLNN